MTEKLYYVDAYIKDFTANLLECRAEGDRYAVILDKTAFFPEEGGQTADGGMIADARVLDVVEKGGEIIHYVDKELALGEVACSLDFEPRFEKMQCHTAEHILCGIIHKIWGYENVGFHLGADLITFDVDGELSRADLDRVEIIANTYVFENRKITTAFPTPDELREITYRAKLDLTEGVRIVTVEGVDACACCAPHVSRTGEIGIIKILDFMRHRGGTRIFMLAGRRALLDYHRRYLVSKEIGALTSTPSTEIAAAVGSMKAELEREREANKELRHALARNLADGIAKTDGNRVVYSPDLLPEDMRVVLNLANDRVGGFLVLLTGTDGDLRYILSKNSPDIRAELKEINCQLNGRGGGRGGVAEGRFAATLDDVVNYFK